MRRASERDQQFTEYVRARRGSLVGTARLMCSGDVHRAEDAVQTALTKLYLVWPTVRPETRDAYARRCVVNAVMDEHRRPFRRREHSASAPPDRPDDAVETDGSDVFPLLGGLPARMRVAVVLRYVDGLSVAETAEVMGCSTGNVKSQCARGLDQLRAALTDMACAVA